MDIGYDLISEMMDFFCDTGHQGFSAEEIEAAERRLGVSFPHTYRSFLRTYGKDEVTTYDSTLIGPGEIYSSYELSEGDHTEDEYIIIWYEKGEWYAGFLKRDLLDGVPDPFVYLCTDDDRLSFMICADDIETFLAMMFYHAACDWNGGKCFGKLTQIEQILSNSGIDMGRRHLPDQGSACPDEKQLHDQSGSPAMVVYFGESEQWLYYGPRHAVHGYFWDIDRSKPEGGIPIHPWIAWMIESTFHHRPSTAYDWNKDIGRMKSLTIEPRFGTIIDEDAESLTVNSPSGYRVAKPYYYDFHDWSVIGQMTKLQTLVIKGVYIDDFSFLTSCKNLRKLDLYNTNFSDCRLLLELPNLKEVNLIFCPLEHTEILQDLSAKYSTEAVFGLCPDLRIESVPGFGKEISDSREIDKLLEADHCRFITKNDVLEVWFSADRAAFIKYTYSDMVFYYDNGSGDREPVELIAGYCPEGRMICYDSRTIRNIVYNFCGGSGRRSRYNKWIREFI